MKTIGENVDEALIKANAVDDTIKIHAVAEVSDWIIEQLQQFRWPFMQDVYEAAMSSDYIALPNDYDKISTVRWKDANGNYKPLEIRRREEFDRLITPGLTGTPEACCIFSGHIHVYPVPSDDPGTVIINYWKKIAEAYTADDTTPFPDAIIKQRAFIAALDYDRLNTEGEVAKLARQVAQLRRNMDDDGSDGASVPLDRNTFGRPPDNWF
jgi:hypothetical protein